MTRYPPRKRSRNRMSVESRAVIRFLRLSPEQRMHKMARCCAAIDSGRFQRLSPRHLDAVYRFASTTRNWARIGRPVARRQLDWDMQ